MAQHVEKNTIYRHKCLTCRSPRHKLADQCVIHTRKGNNHSPRRYITGFINKNENNMESRTAL